MTVPRLRYELTKSSLNTFVEGSNLHDRSPIERRRRVRRSDILIHVCAETNDTVIFGNEHSARAIALRGRSYLPTRDGTDKTAKLDTDRACEDRHMYRSQHRWRGRSRNDKWIKEISLHLNYNDVCDVIQKVKRDVQIMYR